MPAFVELALETFGCRIPDRRDLAIRIGVRVSPDAPNPMNLYVARVGEDTGVSLDRALKSIPVVLQDLSCHIKFAHSPFDQITFRDYESAYDDLRVKDCVVGVGLDWPTLLGVVGESKHVVLLLSYGRQTVAIYDPLYPHLGEQVFPVVSFERAVSSIGDGFWSFWPGKSL